MDMTISLYDHMIRLMYELVLIWICIYYYIACTIQDDFMGTSIPT